LFTLTSSALALITVISHEHIDLMGSIDEVPLVAEPRPRKLGEPLRRPNCPLQRGRDSMRRTGALRWGWFSISTAP
jgi:hypothetical protein